MLKLKLEDAAYYRVKKVEGHRCLLNYKEDTVSYYVKSGAFVPLRRFFRQSIMISTRDPRTNAYVKSKSSVIIEEKNHLEHYYYMIHPFSDFNFLWESFMTVINLLTLIGIPIYYLNKTEDDATPMAPVILLVCLCFIVNIFINFFTGFYDKSKERVVLRPKTVIIRYIFSYFLFDLLSSLSYNLVGNYTKLYEPIWYTRFQWSLKLVRLFTIKEYMDNVQLRYNLPNYLYRVLKYMLFLSVALLWLNFFTYAVDFHYMRIIVNMDLLQKYYTIASKNLRTIFLCDIFKEYYEDIKHLDLYVAVAILQCGKFLEIWFLAQFFQIFASYMVVTQKYQTMLHQVEAFIRFKDLPKRMCRRIYSYLNFRFQCLIFNEKELIDNLCSKLKDEILWHKCQYLVTKVQTFAELPSPIMLKLATMLKPEIYLPNDVVVHSGEVGSEMFFVYVGVLAVFTESGKEICHLSDGSHFGEIALLLNERRVASVVAIDFCELYRLTKNDFQEAIEPYPLVKANIMKAAQDRFKETRILAQQANSVNISLVCESSSENF